MYETVSRTQFWQGIKVLLQQYHTLNKKLFACVIKSVQNSLGSATDESDLFDCLMKQTAAYNDDLTGGFTVHFRFLCKKLTQNIEALGIVDFAGNSYICQFHCDTFDDFCISWTKDELVGKVLTQRLDGQRSKYWLENVLKPKLLKWCQESPAQASARTVTAVKMQTRSLQLIDVEAYNDLYKNLKQQLSANALQLWQDAEESTDPLKFIYEDLAIAAYLITLWRQQDNEHITFVDMGCGNGLLVYILHQAGYNGYGYDLRARKLWSLYPNETRSKLIEATIEPTTFQLPADDVNWLIGNHSDELSPWLPVLAAQASYHMHYFLLPCCAYEFSGAKFQRRHSGKSVYNDFFAYATRISQECGFVTLKDRLKIPSTKRLALIGMARQHTQSEYEQKLEHIANVVLEERRLYSTMEEQVKLRSKTEAVRNCTQIDKQIIDTLVCKIFQLLLQQECKEADFASKWHAGGQLCMRAIAQALSAEDLKHIKSECGGLKTLLRNKHEVFEFHDNDLIGIRRPTAQRKQTTQHKPQTIKKRKCFFQLQHPAGCPLNDEECTFIH